MPLFLVAVTGKDKFLESYSYIMTFGKVYLLGKIFIGVFPLAALLSKEYRWKKLRDTVVLP